MLVFKCIRYRNFLSTGSQWNEIELNKYQSTLITGKNGEGKSTILCALTFSLFGKPFRNVNKAQLINSINKKQCVVEVEFSVNGHDYKVVRGIKPNIFDIHCDGELINQDAALKDYQKVLEQQILKLNYKTFTQVVILGSATFVPFMQLPSAQRREVIEDILDIKIFSLMNVLLKDKAASVKEQITTIEYQIQSQRVKIEAQKKLIEALVTSKDGIVTGLQEKITANDVEITKAQSVIDVLVEDTEKLSGVNEKHEKVTGAILQASKMRVKLSTNIDMCNHNVQFFNNNQNCPTCSQDIAADHKHKVLEELNTTIAEHQSKLNDVIVATEKLNKQLTAANKSLDTIRSKSIEMSSHTTAIKMLTQQNSSYRKEIDGVRADSGNIDDEKSKLRGMAEDAITQVEHKGNLLEQRNLQEVASLLLKDTGIKTAIIREYLPVMNKLINKYLTAMEFYVQFELDEAFSEMIKSRNRDVFTYASFSEGEKQKINLAVMFTWRQIARMKNSVNTNLLIMDEVLDSSLDSAGVETMLSLLGDLDQSNIFIISHREAAAQYQFGTTINVAKRGDFSVVTYQPV